MLRKSSALSLLFKSFSRFTVFVRHESLPVDSSCASESRPEHFAGSSCGSSCDETRPFTARLSPHNSSTTFFSCQRHTFFYACGGGPVNVRVRELALRRRPTVRFGRRVLPRCPWCTGLEAPASAASVLLDGNAAGRTLRSTNRCL